MKSPAVLLTTVLLVAACSSGTGTGGSATAPPTASTAPATGTTSGTGAQAVLAATQAFLATLDDDQRTSVAAERTEANLAQWSNLPDELFERAGLRMDTLDQAQQAAVLTILQAALSPDGYAQVTRITTADGVLAEEGGPDLDFGADHYWIRILGTPAESGRWTVQYGGHHLAVNVTVDGDAMTLAPTLWGAQPSSYEAAGTTTEPLRGEVVKAFAVIDALDAEQQEAAILTTPITEIVLGAGQDGQTLAAEGAAASTFTPEQKQLLLDLVNEWITPLSPEAAAAKLAEVEQDLDATTFAWSGSTEIGNPIYYRVQGPTFVIEFAHQQGRGANAGGITHIHSIYREPGNDYGAQLTP